MPNVIQAENARPGSAGWQLQDPAEAREIEGFCSATSVNRGESIDLKISSAADYELYVYRMGWYDGAAGRLVAGPIALPASVQPAPVLTNQSGTVGVQHQVLECLWDTSYTLAIPATDDWPSGIYLVRAVITSGADAGKDTYLIFCVRDDARASGAGAAEVVFVQPVNTYAAYNCWGGKSLYDTAPNASMPIYGVDYGFTGKGRRVSFNRPYTTFHAAGYDTGNLIPEARWGQGAGDFLTTGRNTRGRGADGGIAGWEFDLVCWLEREGLDVRYVTDVDVHTGAAGLDSARAVILAGHPEYYTPEMRAALVSARDAGVGLDVLGANAVYWRVRYEASSDAAARRTVVCYKDATDPDPLDTRLYRDVGQPEAELVGVQYTSWGSSVALTVAAGASGHWAFAGLGVADGQVLGTNLVGYEFDMTAASTPAGAAVICRTSGFLDNAGASRTHEATLYQAESGAWVFGAGTMQFSWGLSEHGYTTPSLRPAAESALVQGLFRNILAAQGVTLAAAPAPSVIVTDLQYRLGTAGAFTALPTQAEGDTAYLFDTSALPEGTLQVELRARDTSDDAASAWVRRSFTVSHAAVGTVLAINGTTYRVIADEPEVTPAVATTASVRRAFDGTLLTSVLRVGGATTLVTARRWSCRIYDLTPAELDTLRAALANRQRVVVTGDLVGGVSTVCTGSVETAVARVWRNGSSSLRTRVSLTLEAVQ